MRVLLRPSVGWSRSRDSGGRDVSREKVPTSRPAYRIPTPDLVLSRLVYAGVTSSAQPAMLAVAPGSGVIGEHAQGGRIPSVCICTIGWE